MIKHYKHISLIADIFDNEYLAEKPVLIIDDEGDQEHTWRCKQDRARFNCAF